MTEENVMSAKLSADVIRLVDGRNFAHLATLLADGSPHSAQSGSGVKAIAFLSQRTTAL
jgi:hypothetical protein